jgi:hypothetical protein
MATTDIHFVAGALHPVQRGVRWLGGNVDDEIEVDAAGAAIVAGNHTKGTFTAWICVPDDTGTYTFMGFGDKNAVEYVTFSVEAGTIHVMMVKATPTTQIDVNTAAGTIKAHKLHHIAIVQDGSIMKIYIDGEDMPLTWTVETDRAQWFDDLNNIDTAIIGGAISVAGTDAITQEFKGYIGSVRIWSSTNSLAALSAAEVKSVMAGGKPQSTYLHNSWDLEFNLLDDGTGADNGTAAGDIIFSDFNEFSSRLSFLETVPLTADMPVIMADKGVGFAYVILAA